MKIILSEYSSGFSDYSYLLCNELACDSEITNLVYLSDENNPYMGQINDRVCKIKLFSAFKADKAHKKGSIRWALNRYITSVRNCKRRNRFVLQEKPDSLLIQATLSKFDSKYLKALKGKTKIILTVHDVIVPTSSKSWDIKSLKKMYDIADVLVVHSKTNAEQLHDMFYIPFEKIKVIPHGIKSEYRKLDKQYCREKLNIHDNKRILLFYGNIRESKGLDILIQALKGVNCRLIIAGSPFYGETFDAYRKLIEENKICTTEFIEFTDDAFRDILFQASDFLVLPYKEFYSQSGVFMQGIQYHLPIIATDVSSFREYIEHYGIGFIANANDSQNLHDVIVAALKNTEDYEANMCVAVKENSWETVGAKYAEVLRVK